MISSIVLVVCFKCFKCTFNFKRLAAEHEGVVTCEHMFSISLSVIVYSDLLLVPILLVTMQGWRAFYIKWQTEMAERVVSIVELVKQSARYESLEVGDYQRAMELLKNTEMGFKDVQLYLLTPKRSVLVNLIGLHYCLVWLGIQVNKL